MTQPVRIGIAGLSHDHVFGLWRRPKRDDIEIVGIYEPDRALAERYAKRFGFPFDRLFDDLGAMIDAVHPEAVTAFGSIFDHKQVVDACAPRGVHVMVEKPLAVSNEHATAMAALAREHGIHLLTNYETSWYATTYAAYQKVIAEKQIGLIRKVVVHDGHFGPRELGCSEDFLAWLTDPVLNGGGALIDFGCYGANLVTWLMGGQLPQTVTAVTQTFKPEIYPKVDDEASILLTYPGAQAIIQASWNWPVSRKDMEIYGQNGQVLTVDGLRMRVRMGDRKPEEAVTLAPNPAPADDPFSFLAAVVRGEMGAGALSTGAVALASLENNLNVVTILDAAREFARLGQTVKLGI